MSVGVLDQVASWYTNSLKEHGIQASGVGWTDADRHKLRFDKLCELVRDANDFSVNDLGCGYGALYPHLVQIGKQITFYRGYEISEPMLTAARENLPHENIELLLGSALDKHAEFGFASGIFNVNFQEDDAKWLNYIEETLVNMNTYCDKGFAFNLLTKYVDWQAEDLYYGDPLYFFDFCRSNFSSKVTLFHDYELWEWTMVVRKD